MTQNINKTKIETFLKKKQINVVTGIYDECYETKCCKCKRIQRLKSIEKAFQVLSLQPFYPHAGKSKKRSKT